MRSEIMNTYEMRSCYSQIDPTEQIKCWVRDRDEPYGQSKQI